MTDTPAALKAPFDPAKLEAAVAARDASRIKLDDSAKRLDEMFQGTQGDDGKGFTAEEQTAYQNMAISHKNLETAHARLEADVKTLELRDPAKAAVRKDNATDVAVLTERYIRASSDREAAEMLASDDFKGLVTGKDAGKGVPANSLQLGSMIAAKVRSDSDSGAGAGQDAVDSTTYRGIIDRLQEYGGMSKLAYSFSTNTGEPFIVPRGDNASQEGEILANQAANVADQATNAITSVEIGAETVSSRRIAISNEMIQDSVFDIVGWVERTLVRRIGRLKNRVTTTGKIASGGDAGDFNGVTGIAKDSGVNITITSGATTYDDLVDLIYSIDPAYREGMESGYGGFTKPGMGAVGFMMHEDVEKALVKLVDSEGRPLWNVSTRVDHPNMILGYPYVINQHLDDVSANGNIPLMFGDFSYHWIRNIANLSLFNFWDSNTAQANERHLLGFYRGASEYVGPVDSNSKADAIAFADVG